VISGDEVSASSKTSASSGGRGASSSIKRQLHGHLVAVLPIVFALSGKLFGARLANLLGPRGRGALLRGRLHPVDRGRQQAQCQLGDTTPVLDFAPKCMASVELYSLFTDSDLFGGGGHDRHVGGLSDTQMRCAGIILLNCPAARR
jgi:hypothetical protein